MSADGAPVERLLDVETRPLLSVFLPDRLELLKGAPALRRAHLDQFVAALWPLRARRPPRLLARARPAQRAARAASAPAAPRARRSPTWDRELAGQALALREHRAEAVALLAEPFAAARVAARLQRRARALEYRPRSRAADEEEFVAELQARLAERPRARLLRPRTPPRRAGARCATAASCASTAPRASSAWRCSRCCSPSARCSPASAAARR